MTASDWSISGLERFMIGTSEHALTRMVAMGSRLSRTEFVVVRFRSLEPVLAFEGQVEAA